MIPHTRRARRNLKFMPKRGSDADSRIFFDELVSLGVSRLRATGAIRLEDQWARIPLKGALSQDTAHLMVFKLVIAASKTWRRLQGQNQLPKIINGAKLKDGIEIVREAISAA
jgi:hypothetical protein